MRRRAFERHMVDLPVTLEPVAPAKGGTVSARLLDLSFTGARIATQQALNIGTLWRLALSGKPVGAECFMFAVRSCQEGKDGTFGVGGQFIAHPSAIQSAGVPVTAIASQVHSLMRSGSEPGWNTPWNLIAKGSIAVEDLAAVQVSVQKDLLVASSIVDCTLDVGGRLQAPEAVMFGGTAHLLGGASIGELGRPDGQPTRIFLGSSLRSAALIAGARAAIDEHNRNITQARAAVEQLRGGTDHASREKLTVLMTELESLEHARDRMAANVRSIETTQARRACASLEVTRAVHPGVVLEFDSSRLVIRARVDGTAVFSNDKNGVSLSVRGVPKALDGIAEPTPRKAA